MPERTLKECYDGLESQRKGFNKIVQSLDDKIDGMGERVGKMGVQLDEIDKRCKSNDDWIHEGGKELVSLVERRDAIKAGRGPAPYVEMPNTLWGPPDQRGVQRGSSCGYVKEPDIEPDIERLAEVAHHANMGARSDMPHPWEDQSEMYQDLMRGIARAIVKDLGHEGEEPGLQGHYPDPDEKNQCRVCGDQHPLPPEEETCDNCGIDACMKRGVEGVRWCDEWTCLPPAEEPKKDIIHIPTYYLKMTDGQPECPECGQLYQKPGPDYGIHWHCLTCGANMVVRKEPPAEEPSCHAERAMPHDYRKVETPAEDPSVCVNVGLGMGCKLQNCDGKDSNCKKYSPSSNYPASCSNPGYRQVGCDVLCGKCTSEDWASVHDQPEEPDGRQCETCGEYSDACVCVCAVEEAEEHKEEK